MKKNVSVIVPTYHDWRRLQLCIDALAAQTYPHSDFEIIVVNNDPADAMPATFRLPENARCISEAKPGSYAARNTALLQATGEIIGFTDSDCIPDKNWIANAVRYLSENSSCSRLAGHIAIICKGAKPSLAETYNAIYSFPQKWHAERVGTSVTANLFTYKRVFDEVGMFNANLMSLGDSKWSHLARKAGHQVHYVADVIVNHPARTLYQLIRKERRHGGGDGLHRKKESLYRNVRILLHDLRPKKRELEFLRVQGQHLSRLQRLRIMCVRQLALNLRVIERFLVQMGKTPIRD